MMNDEQLRAAYNAHVEANPPVDRANCPTPEQLQTLASGNNAGSNPFDMKMLEHVMSCTLCRRDFDLLRAVQMAANEAPARRSPFTPARMAIAAMLLLAVGVGGEMWQRMESTTVRANPADASDVALISPLTGSPARVPAKFAWHRVLGADNYQLEVLDSAGIVVITQITSDTVVQLRGADSVRVTALPLFDWMVTARRTDGNERRSSMTRVRIGASRSK